MNGFLVYSSGDQNVSFVVFFFLVLLWEGGKVTSVEIILGNSW